MTSLLILLLTADPRLFELRIGIDQHSKHLESELTRDWNARGISHQTERLRHIQFRLRDRVKLVSDPLETSPAWRYGEYQAWQKFDERAFSDTGRPLETLQVIIHNTELDLVEWKKECAEAEWSAELAHWRTAWAWVKKHHPDRFKADKWTEYDWDIARRFRERYDTLEGFPQYVPPILPPCPLMAMPWE